MLLKSTDITDVATLHFLKGAPMDMWEADASFMTLARHRRA